MSTNTSIDCFGGKRTPSCEPTAHLHRINKQVEMTKIRLNRKGHPVFEIDVELDKDNIFTLKKKIEESELKYPAKEILLNFNGEALEPISYKYLAPRPLSDFGIKENSLVELHGGIKVFAKLPGARIHQTIVTLFTNDTIADIKRAIKEKAPEAPDLNKMVLLQDNDILDDDKMLSEYEMGIRWWFTCVTVQEKD